MGLAYATSDRGGCHQRAWTVKTELNDPELNRFSFEKKAGLVKDVQDERAAFFSLVHRIENITSNIGKIEFPFILTKSYETMDKSSH